MKQKKSSGSHPVGNRTVVGIICIVVALAICFGIAPLVNRLSDGKTEIVRLIKDVPAGATIAETDIEVVEVGSYNLPSAVITDKTQVIGKCAMVNLSAGEYLLPGKVGEDLNNAQSILESLDTKHKAISITINSYALGFSGKLETGDIVSILVYDEEEDEMFTPSELTYVKVITTTTANGVDKDFSDAYDNVFGNVFGEKKNSKGADLIAALPFMDKEDLRELVNEILSGDERYKDINLVAIMPFLDTSDCDALFMKFVIEENKYNTPLVTVVPFVSKKCLSELVDEYIKGNYQHIEMSILYPFLDGKDVKKVFSYILNKNNDKEQQT